MNKLVYFDFPKERLKINVVNRCEHILESIKTNSEEKNSLPDVNEYYNELFFPKAPVHRPYTFSSVVLSADGKMAFTDNSAGPLVAKNNFLDPDGALGDFWVLNILRAYSDGVIIGANTLKSEPGITSHVYDKALVEQREKYLNKKYHPASIIVSLDGTDILFEHFLFNIDPSERYKTLIATSPDGFKYIAENSPLKHTVIGPFVTKEDVCAFQFPKLFDSFDITPVIVTGAGNTPDSELMLYVLKKWGIERLCIESPTYCSHMLKNKWLDEYFINYSMVYAGGGITPGYSLPHSHLEHPHGNLLVLGVHKSSFMFTRQQICYDVTKEVDLNSYKY